MGGSVVDCTTTVSGKQGKLGGFVGFLGCTTMLGWEKVFGHWVAFIPFVQFCPSLALGRPRGGPWAGEKVLGLLWSCVFLPSSSSSFLRSWSGFCKSISIDPGSI